MAKKIVAKGLKSGMSLTDMAEIYGVSLHVMKIWVEDCKGLGDIKARSLKPWQIKKIINHLDEPL